MKTCFKCGKHFPLSDFYTHKRMHDGHLNKCKSCTKQDVEIRRQLKLKDPEWVENEYERHRIKQRKYREEGKCARVPMEKRKLSLAKYRLRFPLKKQAVHSVRLAIKSGKLKRLPCVVCGCAESHGHHEDYSKPLDVVWLCAAHHAERHNELRREMRTKAPPTFSPASPHSSTPPKLHA